MSKKFLYLFKEGHDAFGGDQTTMKNTLGGKGAGLAEMTHAGMPVPQGFTITGNDEARVAEQVREYAYDFDPDEHAEMWVESRGKRGVPDSIRTLIDDADAIKEMAFELADALRKAEEEYQKEVAG